MTTNVSIGFPFGIISILLHFFLLIYDPRRSYRYYNISLLLWVTGNYIWMTIEFMSSRPSSNVHIGPHVPLGGLSESTENILINVKTFLFLISSVIQLFMYFGIFINYIKMPEEEDEDIISKNEAFLFCYGNKSYELTIQNPNDNMKIRPIDSNDIDDIDEIEFHFVNGIQNTLTLAYIENAYIIFWISKDLFWSWGTGDLTKGKDLAIMYEAFAMCFGLLSIFIYTLTAYLYRRNILRLFDCITTIFWISANYVWMCGEFFIRYDNLSYDDEDAGNDTLTRIISSILFGLGLSIQLSICLFFLYRRIRSSSGESESNSPQTIITSSSSSINPMMRHGRSGSFEMVSVQSGVKYNKLLVPYSPQYGRKIEEFDEEEIIVF